MEGSPNLILIDVSSVTPSISEPKTLLMIFQSWRVAAAFSCSFLYFYPELSGRNYKRRTFGVYRGRSGGTRYATRQKLQACYSRSEVGGLGNSRCRKSAFPSAGGRDQSCGSPCLPPGPVEGREERRARGCESCMLRCFPPSRQSRRCSGFLRPLRPGGGFAGLIRSSSCRSNTPKHSASHSFT